MPSVLRLALPSDVPAVVPLLNAAYGAHPTFEERFRAYRSLEPEGWIVAEEGASILGVGGFVVFGRCAYVGLMAVSPAAQRRGIGAAIFDELVARCDARGVALLLLDASDAGAPLYAKRGFRDHGRALSFALDPRVERSPDASVRIDPVAAEDGATVSAIARFDARCFGADRSAFFRDALARFRDRACVARDALGEIAGYAIAQRHSIGPCMARSAAIARALVTRSLTLSFDGERVTWLVPEQNGAAAALASAMGAGPVRQWRHMRKGEESALGSEWTEVFGKASLAVG
jgi:GNAT superfamily N-acetyltransferase